MHQPTALNQRYTQKPFIAMTNVELYNFSSYNSGSVTAVVSTESYRLL
jgi:hypothetical protein